MKPAFARPFHLKLGDICRRPPTKREKSPYKVEKRYANANQNDTNSSREKWL